MADILTVLSKKYTLKAGDIIEVRMDWEILIPEDEEIGTTIDPDDYDNKYQIFYYYPEDAGSTVVDILEEAGCCTIAGVEDYIQNHLEDDIPEIEEYEIFDVDDKNGECQKAKIRVKAIKTE